MEQKNNSVSSAETNDDSSTIADVTTSSPNNAKPYVRRSAFTITIDDSFSNFEFGFEPKNADELCVDDIVKVLEEHFKTTMVYAKCIREW